MTAATPKSANELAEARTDLALERTVMAADRTLMAWVRTALSMISFGFTIYKFLQTVPNKAVLNPQGPRNLGLTLIGLGVISLIISSVQYVAFLRRLGRPPRWSHMVLWIAGAVGIIGLVALVNIVFKIGPF